MSEIDLLASRLSAAITDSDQVKDANGIQIGNEVLVRALLDTVPALMWSVSPSGEPSYINQRVG